MAIEKAGGEQIGASKIVKNNYGKDVEPTSDIARNDTMTPRDAGMADKAPYAKGGM